MEPPQADIDNCKEIIKEKENMSTGLIERKKSGSCLLIIGGGEAESSCGHSGEGQEGTSLQDSFMKFRQQKMQEHKLMKMCREASLRDGRTSEFKENLRLKFIDQAKKYLGVPYHIRYKKEQDPVAPIYLDCCGLVRKAVQDLQLEFGFVIGKWNQAYQMDTLPIVLKEQYLRPGDLIFYEGIYVNERSKKQKHNNVHVEIFIGGETGEATIGSRFHRGNVSIFPSFKFKSTSWDLVQYHFRSLDTWLSGECRSHCPEHEWCSDALNYVEAAGKRSIFSEEHDEDDVSAGGEESDHNDSYEVPGSILVECEGAADADTDDKENQHGGSDSGEDGTIQQRLLQAQKEVFETAPSAAETVEMPSLESTKDSEDEPTDPTQKSKVVKMRSTKVKPVVGTNTKERRRSTGATPLPAVSSSKQRPTAQSAKVAAHSGAPEATSATKTDESSSSQRPKRVSKYRAGSIDAGKADSPSASGKGSSATADRREMSKSLSEIDMKNSRSRDFSHTYYVNKTNGWRMVRDSLDKRGWTQLPFDYGFTTKYGLKWVERRISIDYAAHTPGQLVCHLPNNDIITTKIGLLSTLRDKFCRAPPGVASRVHAPWLPHTYDLECPADCIALIKEEERLLSGGTSDHNDEQQAKSSSGGGIWIYKPSCKNRGRGIRVISGLDSLKELCYGKPMGKDPDHGTSLPYKGIVQKYITDPLLVMEEGFKFDIRCYLLVARNYPTTLAFYSPGYVRLALKPYSLDSLDDSCAHLTNASVQKKDNPIYGDNKDIQVQSMEDIANVLQRTGQVENAEFIRSGALDHQIKLCLVDVMKASNHVFLKKHGYFDLLGCDFMMSKSNKVSMLEINTNPALTQDNAALARILPDVVDGTIDLVLKSQGPDRRITDPDDFLKDSMPPGFSLIFDEGTGYCYREKRRRKKSKSSTKTVDAEALAEVTPAADEAPLDAEESFVDALNETFDTADEADA